MQCRVTHQHWREMIQNCSVTGLEVGRISATNTQLSTLCTITQEEARKEVELQADHESQPAERPKDVDRWSFVSASTSGEGLGRGNIFSPVLTLACCIIMVV